MKFSFFFVHHWRLIGLTEIQKAKRKIMKDVSEDWRTIMKGVCQELKLSILLVLNTQRGSMRLDFSSNLFFSCCIMFFFLSFTQRQIYFSISTRQQLMKNRKCLKENIFNIEMILYGSENNLLKIHIKCVSNHI